MGCPPECVQDREKLNENQDLLFDMAIPVWVRNLLIAGVLFGFALVGGLYLYGVERYATRMDIGALERRLERIEEKLDALMAKEARRSLAGVGEKVVASEKKGDS